MNPSRPSPRRTSMAVTTGPRACLGCGDPLVKPRTYTLTEEEWRKRKFCSKTCRDARLREENRARYGPPKPALAIPDSARRVATWAGVSTRCWKCQTGLWKRITGGVSCLQCGMDCYVAEALPG